MCQSITYKFNRLISNTKIKISLNPFFKIKKIPLFKIPHEKLKEHKKTLNMKKRANKIETKLGNLQIPGAIINY